MIEREILTLRYIKEKKNELPPMFTATCKEPKTSSFWAERPGTSGSEIIRITQNSEPIQRYIVKDDGSYREELNDPDRLEIVIYR